MKKKTMENGKCRQQDVPRKKRKRGTKLWETLNSLLGCGVPAHARPARGKEAATEAHAKGGDCGICLRTEAAFDDSKRQSADVGRRGCKVEHDDQRHVVPNARSPVVHGLVCASKFRRLKCPSKRKAAWRKTTQVHELQVGRISMSKRETQVSLNPWLSFTQMAFYRICLGTRSTPRNNVQHHLRTRRTQHKNVIKHAPKPR